MYKLFILGVSLSLVLSAGTAMAAGDQTSETFQTLGQMQPVENTAITQMTDTDLNAVEGKMRSRGYEGYEGYSGHTGGYTQYSRSNFNTTEQINSCVSCFAYGGYDGGGGGNITQYNDNNTQQYN
jgi:hypothetical protein